MRPRARHPCRRWCPWYTTAQSPDTLLPRAATLSAPRLLACHSVSAAWGPAPLPGQPQSKLGLLGAAMHGACGAEAWGRRCCRAAQPLHGAQPAPSRRTHMPQTCALLALRCCPRAFAEPRHASACRCRGGARAPGRPRTEHAEEARGAAAGLLPERVPGAGAPGQLQHHARGGGAGRRVQRARGGGARARGAPHALSLSSRGASAALPEEERTSGARALRRAGSNIGGALGCMCRRPAHPMTEALHDVSTAAELTRRGRHLAAGQQLSCSTWRGRLLAHSAARG